MKKIIRGIALAAALMLLSSAMADSAVVFNTSSRVYQSADLTSSYLPVKSGTQATLLGEVNGWAAVEISGVTCYTNPAHLSETVSETELFALLATAKDVVTLRATRVYAYPSESASSIKLPKNFEMRLLKTVGSWALVEKNGCYAYISSDNVAEKTSQSVDYSSLLANAKDAVITADAKIYQSADTSSASANVAKDMEVKLLVVNGGWALIEKNGIYAYISSDNVAEKITQTVDYSSLLANAKDAVVTADSLIYQSADASSASTTVAKGTKVRLLAINDGWALVEKDGAYAFMSSDRVTVGSNVTVAADYMSSSKYSNQEKCYLFLTRELGYSRALACGILANFNAECSFNPTLGSSYYGLCQWGGGRLSNLKKYCEKNGYDYTSLEGQMRFMDYELKNSYPAIWKKLAAVENTAEGAYDAGYIFCYEYERPAAKSTSSVKRGNKAKETYFPKYQSW